MLAAVPAYGQAPVFTKTLKKVNGVTVTSPPASLNNGDVLDWVMTYQFIHNSAQPAQANIQDLLSPTLRYVTGSLQVPPSWSKQWFNGSWIASEPAAAQGVGATISFPHVGPSGTGQTVLVPAPPVASVNTTGSGGDGYRAIPYNDNTNDNVYVINHHISGTYLNCFVAATGLRCAGYPVHPPNTNGALFNSNNNDNSTPYKPIEYLDRNTGKLYFPVIDTAANLGILCADLKNKKSCGFYALETSGTGLQDISGIGGIGGKVYVQLHDGKIGCFDTTTATACAGQPYPALSYNSPQTESSSEIVGTKIYSVWQSSPSPYYLGCFDTAIPGPCTGWSPNPKTVTGTTGILYPLLNGGGTVTGMCVHTTAGGSSFDCYDLSTGAVLSGVPVTYTNWVNTFGGGPLNGLGLGQTGYYKTRVFNSNSSATMGCYDFATQAPCGGSFPLSGITASHYATIADPDRPGCMWYYGDDGKLGSFLAANGSACDSTTVVDTIVTPASSYCAGGAVSGWGKLSISGLTLGGGITATLTLYDGSNPANLAVNASAVPYAQNLPVTSLPLTLGNIGYGTAPGQYKSLRIVLQINGVSNHAPWTQVPPPNAEINLARRRAAILLPDQGRHVLRPCRHQPGHGCDDILCGSSLQQRGADSSLQRGTRAGRRLQAAQPMLPTVEPGPVGGDVVLQGIGIDLGSLHPEIPADRGVQEPDAGLHRLPPLHQSRDASDHDRLEAARPGDGNDADHSPWPPGGCHRLHDVVQSREWQSGDFR